MRTFRNLSIRGKLIVIMMVTSSLALLLMALAVLVNEAVSSQESIREQLSTLAEVIGSRSTGALTFDDRQTAEENLEALRVKKSIVYAVITHKDGDIFAEYRPNGDEAVHSVDDPIASFFSDHIEVSTDIRLDGEKIGRIRIVASLEEFFASLFNYILLTFGIVAACFGVALLLSTRLQRVISEPVLRLRQAMRTVSEQRDYSVRVEDGSDDELAALVDGFNDMLAQIQMRDTELARYSNKLEEEIAARTAELSEANEKRIAWLETLAHFLRHELKNTTVGIKTSLDLIERRAGNESVGIYLGRARKSMAYMTALLESVSQASTLEATFYKEPRASLDLYGLVTSYLYEYQTIYPEQALRADCDDGITVLGNRVRLIQMLDKLVANATEHCKPGSAIQILLKRQTDMALLSIVDEGDELPDDKERIFQLFVSMRASERKKDDHFGLGLYIVKLIAESHGGRVEARDLEEKTGAVFTVTLPLA